MVANDNPTSPTSSIIENMGSPLSSNAADLSHIDHSLRVAAAATNVTPVQGNGSTSPTSVSSTAHPTFNDNMDVDMDDIPSMQQCASADNADHLQELADATNQLTKLIAVVSSKLPTLHGEARLTALQEIQDLALTVKTSNELLTSFAPTQSNNKPTTLVANLPQSTQSASIRPDNLPYFQWEGSVFDAHLPWSVDVDACLTKFEDVMNFYSLAFDKEFLRLVPPMLSPTQRTTWYQSFLMNHQAPTWVDFKSCFKARYGISVIDDRQKCAAELMNISFQPNESFHSLVDKFNDLRRRAFDQLPQPFLLVSRLMLILPSSLRSQVNIVRQSKGLTSITADTVIKIAQELLASMTPSEVNAAMGYTAPATPAPPSSKAAAAPTATTTIPIQHGYAGKVNKPAPSGNRFPPHGSSNNMYTSPSRRGQKYCTYHKSRAHNTNECNAYAAALSSASTSERGGNPHCDNCGAPNYIEGYVCKLPIVSVVLPLLQSIVSV